MVYCTSQMVLAFPKPIFWLIVRQWPWDSLGWDWTKYIDLYSGHAASASNLQPLHPGIYNQNHECSKHLSIDPYEIECQKDIGSTCVKKSQWDV